MVSKIIKPVISIAAVFLVWELACVLSGASAALFPSPVEVWKAFLELSNDGLSGSASNVLLLGHTLISLARFFAGYGAAVVSGVLLGLFGGRHPGIFGYVNPIVQLVRPIAPVAFMPFIVFWFGIGNIPAVVIIFIAGFFPILLSTVSAVRDAEPVYSKIAAGFEVGHLKTTFDIIFPAIFSRIMNALRLALGSSWIFLVSGEMVGARSGLGFLIMDCKNCVRFDALLATMITIGVIGFALDGLTRALENRVQKIYGNEAV